jgi:class 3 adenylate cyclase/tetratricopeptide (TPR) repeat protein
MNCAECGHENRAGRRFCAECGAALPSACSSCGFFNEPAERFCGGCGEPLAAGSAAVAMPNSPRAYTPRHLAEKILTSASALEGERKQVTVHFVDVSGFTSLSERLDPEEVHDTMRRTFDLLLEAVHRYEGTVNQFLGDGIMALYGAPIAHEDHAQRAVLAALAIRGALASFRDDLLRSRGIGFQVRQGLNSGLVVVGSIGSDLRMDYTAVGDTTNVAARLQQAAAPGQVVVSEATQRLVAHHFEMRSLGERSLKGKAAPVGAWEVLSARATRSRVEIEVDRGLTPFAGRAAEIRHLLECFEQVKRGNGQIAFVSGEPGVGKSRLLHELRRRLGDEASWMEGRCVSFGRSIAFHPLIDLVRRTFGIEPGAVGAEAVALVERGVRGLGAQGAEVADTVPYLCSLLSIDAGDPAIAAMDPQTRRGETLAALRQLVELATQPRPLVLVIEDLHWSDEATEGFLAAIAERLTHQRVLTILTYRPGFAHRFGDRASASTIALSALSMGEADEMAEAVLARRGLPDDLRPRIVARAEGNPFYMEELIRSLEKSGGAVPDTVQGLIAARVDRLTDQPKRVLQIASVIGRDFPHRLLAELADAESIDADLRDLAANELIQPRSDLIERTYTFNHALTQDVVYETILLARRREIHRSIAEITERLDGDRLAAHYEVLAHHYFEGESWQKALEYLLKGAGKAAAAFGQREALALFERALGVARRLGDAAPAGTLIQIHAARCNLFFGVGEFAHSRSEADALLELARAGGNRALEAAGLALGAHAAVWMEDFDEGVAAANAAIALAEETGFLPPLGGGLLITGLVHAITGRHDEADAQLTRALAVAQQAKDFDNQGSARFLIGTLRNWHGRYAEGLDQALEGVRVGRELQLVVPLIRCLWVAGVSRAGLGDYQGALAALHEGLALAEKSGDEAYLARILNTLGWLHIDCHDFAPGMELSERGLVLARSSRDATGPERAAFTLINEGDALVAQGELELATEVLGEAHHIVRHPPPSRWMTWRYATHCHVSLGELALARGDLARAVRCADACLEIAVPTRSRKYESQAWRLKGGCAARRQIWDEAQAALARALLVATEIGEPRQMWQSHAALAALHRARGAGVEADRSARAAGGILERVRSQVSDPGLAAGLARVQATLGD